MRIAQISSSRHVPIGANPGLQRTFADNNGTSSAVAFRDHPDKADAAFTLEDLPPSLSGKTLTLDDAQERAAVSGVAEESGDQLCARMYRVDESNRIIHLDQPRLAISGGDCLDEELLESCRLRQEIFILPSAADLSFAPRGLPLWILRLAAALGPAGQAQVDTVFNANPPRYDTAKGASYFVGNLPDWANLTFFANRYRAAQSQASSVLNCYDAAAALQVLLKAAGYPVQFCYMMPFGYLAQTALIGRGQSNNPFPSGGAGLVVPRNDQRRRGFANHAFCELNLGPGSFIADACAGPHYNDSRASYVANAIDTVVPNPPQVASGTVANIRDYAGVTNISNLVTPGRDFMSFMVEEDAEPSSKVSQFIAAIGLRDLASEPRRAVILPDPRQAPDFNNLELVYDDLAIGYPETNREWRFACQDGFVTVTAHVTSGPSVARDRFLAAATVNQSPTLTYGPGPEGLGDAAARSLVGDPMTILWLKDNVVVSLSSTIQELDLERTARWLQHNMQYADAVPDLGLSVEAPETVEVGQQFHLVVARTSNTLVDFAFSADLGVFLGERDNHLEFVAHSAGSWTIGIVVVDRVTLQSTQQSVTISIR